MAAVLAERRDHFHHAGVFQNAALGAWTHQLGNGLDVACRKGKPGAWHGKAGGIGNRRRLDGRFRAVEEAIEHLRVEATAVGLLLRQAPVLPDGFRCRQPVFRLPFVPAAGGGDAKAAAARPVDKLGRQRRLVAIGKRIENTGVTGPFGKAGTAVGISLDGDIHHVLAVCETGGDMIDRRDRVAGAFDHQVDERAGGKRRRILGQEYAAGSRCILGRGCGERSGRPADEFEIRARSLDRQVGDSDNLHAGKLADLCKEHAAELAGPDHADPDRLAGFLKLKKFLMKRHEHTSGTRPQGA